MRLAAEYTNARLTPERARPGREPLPGRLRMRRQGMDSTKRTARLAGLLYLVSSIPAPFALIFVPGRLFVEGNPAATAERLRSSESLLRAGIAAEIFSSVLFIFVALTLYRLFKPVSEPPALAMLVLILISSPISFFNILNELAAFNLAGGGAGAPPPAAARFASARRPGLSVDAPASRGVHGRGGVLGPLALPVRGLRDALGLHSKVPRRPALGRGRRLRR